MGDEVTVGSGDARDPAVRRLIDPAALSALAAGRESIAVVRAKGVPIAVAAGVEHAGRIEILSLACLTAARDTPALRWAVQRLRGSQVVVFDPTAPLELHIRQALTGAGMRQDGPLWTYYRLVPAAMTRVRSTVTVTAAPSTLRCCQPRGYDPHPDDLLDDSPVLLLDGVPVAYAVVRTGGLLQWLWVDPAHRRQGLVMQLCAVLFDRSQAAVTFRVDAANAAMHHVLHVAPEGTVEELFREPGWVG